jgi:cysteine desulfuration protein SufE
MTIEQTQKAIMEDFALLDGDREMSVMYLMDLGEKLPSLGEEHKQDINLVKGCQSKVWLVAELKKDRIFFSADSNTAITKGLVSLLIRVFNGHLPEEILSADLFFMKEIGMDRFIGTQRSNGFASMIQRMKQHARSFQTQSDLTA